MSFQMTILAIRKSKTNIASIITDIIQPCNWQLAPATLIIAAGGSSIMNAREKILAFVLLRIPTFRRIVMAHVFTPKVKIMYI